MEEPFSFIHSVSSKALRKIAFQLQINCVLLVAFRRDLWGSERASESGGRERAELEEGTSAVETYGRGASLVSTSKQIMA